jgi:hypothetical protein
MQSSIHDKAPNCVSSLKFNISQKTVKVTRVQRAYIFELGISLIIAELNFPRVFIFPVIIRIIEWLKAITQAHSYVPVGKFVATVIAPLGRR